MNKGAHEMNSRLKKRTSQSSFSQPTIFPKLGRLHTQYLQDSTETLF